MRKMWVFALLVLLCTCVSTGNSKETDLDGAIQLASKDINDFLLPETKVALLNFSSSSDVFSDYVLEEMSIALVRGRKLVVVDRKEIDLIRGEMNFQMSGEVSDESAQEIGKILGAQSIISGSLISMGNSYRFRTKVINVNSAAIETSSSISVGDDPQVRYLLSQGGGDPAPQTTATKTAQQPSQQHAQQASQGGSHVSPAQADSSRPVESTLSSYKIGDTGPAGGLIFYDKGNDSGGWRYLEAAPVEAEFRAAWNVRDTFVDNTQTAIGSGKRNTQLIEEKFRLTAGEWDTAAQKADELEFNGFDDWFLPSQAELDQMYGNLKRKNLGDYKNERYWSSTELNDGFSHSQDFRTGQMFSASDKLQRNCVRAVRWVL